MTDGAHPPRIRLRDLTLADADRYDAMVRRERADGGFNDFGIDARPVDRAALARGPIRDDQHGVMLVERLEDGAILGAVSWHRERYGPNPESGAWNMGIDLEPEARGRGYGSEAQRLLADELFRTTSANRVEASTDVENLAEQRSLEKAGFTREGISRGAQFRAGRYHDLVIYSRLRNDPA